MTRAEMIFNRDMKIALLGDYPPWWRPLARRRWMAAVEAILEDEIAHMIALFRDAAGFSGDVVAKPKRKSAERTAPVMVGVLSLSDDDSEGNN